VDAALASPVTLKIGALTLKGAPVPGMDGIYMTQRRVRLAGGAAAWARELGPKGYHNDAGVKARLVVEDLVRELGEQLGTFTPAAERIGVDFAREQGPASRALCDVIGSVAWWVDYAGVTQVGVRPTSTPDPSTYQVLSFDPAERTATLNTDDPSVIGVGSVLPEGTVRELEIVAGGEDALRINVWLGGAATDPSRLVGLFKAITERATDARLFGLYRYQVMSQGGDDRMSLRAVSPGVPDLNMISPWQGIAGTRSRVTVGSEVLVQFIDGDRAQPVIVAYAPHKSNGFAPVGLVFGGAEGSPAARKGDSVALPVGTTFTFTVGTTVTTGTITAWGGSGTISTGSDIVSIAPKFPELP
jgi:hypothetical protein